MDFEKVREFAGPILPEDMKYVDHYIGEHMGIFIPNGGFFEHALEPHRHPAYQFAFMYHERAFVSIENRLISLEPGSLLCISPMVEHYEVPTDLQSRYCAVNIRREHIEELYNKYTGKCIPDFRGEYYELTHEIPELVKSYVYEHTQKRLGYEAVCSSLEKIIIQKILRSIVGEKLELRGLNVRIEVEKAVQYMYQHMHHKIALEDLANDSQMSISRFSFIFKEQLGSPPMDYLNDLRLERARMMLLLGNKSILEISQECGFGSTSYFTTRFSRKFSCTPSLYRQQHKTR
jgi:AraC-like DNA-binding protein